MQTIIVGVIVACAAGLLAWKAFKVIRRKCGGGKKDSSCGKCSGCG